MSRAVSAFVGCDKLRKKLRDYANEQHITLENAYDILTAHGDLITLKTLAYGSMVLLAPSVKIEYTTITGDNPQQAVLYHYLAAEFFLKGSHEGHFKLKDISFDDGNDSSASTGRVMYEKHIAEMTRCEGFGKKMHKGVPDFAEIFYAPCTGMLAVDGHLQENQLAIEHPSQYYEA